MKDFIEILSDKRATKVAVQRELIRKAQEERELSATGTIGGMKVEVRLMKIRKIGFGFPIGVALKWEVDATDTTGSDKWDAWNHVFDGRAGKRFRKYYPARLVFDTLVSKYGLVQK